MMREHFIDWQKHKLHFVRQNKQTWFHNRNLMECRSKVGRHMSLFTSMSWIQKSSCWLIDREKYLTFVALCTSRLKNDWRRLHWRLGLKQL